MKTIEPNSDRLQTVSIDIKNNRYKRFVDITNTPSHVLAEFVDNALQSFRDNKLLLEYLEPGYKMQVYINFDFDHLRHFARREYQWKEEGTNSWKRNRF